MLGKSHQQEEQNSISLPTYTPVLHPETMSEAEIEDYLDQAYAVMIGRVGYEGRQRMRQVLRARLESLIAAYQELGYSRAEAISLTLQPLRTEATAPQNTLSQDLQEETNALQQSKSLAFRYFGGASLVYLLALASIDGNTSSDKQWMLLPFFFWLPLITGVFVGGRAKTRPVLSTLRAIGLLSLPFALLHPIWVGLYNLHGSHEAGMVLNTLNFFCWTLSGTVGAAIGGGLRKYFKPGGVVNNPIQRSEVTR